MSSGRSTSSSSNGGSVSSAPQPAPQLPDHKEKKEAAKEPPGKKATADRKSANATAGLHAPSNLAIIRTVSEKELSAMIIKAIKLYQPKRLLRIFSSVGPQEIKKFLAKMKEDPLEMVVDLFSKTQKVSDLSSLNLIVLALIAFGANKEKGEKAWLLLPFGKRNLSVGHSISNIFLNSENYLDTDPLISLFDYKEHIEIFEKEVVSQFKSPYAFRNDEFKNSAQLYLVFLDTFSNGKADLKQLEAYIKNIDKYLLSQPESHQVLLYPELTECSCANHNFDRFKNSRRKDLEQKIMLAVAEKFTLADNFQLNVLSLGSGGLLQDFILICQLILQGQKNIYYVIYEPNLNQNALRQLKVLVLFAANNGIFLKIDHYSDLTDYKNNGPIDKRFHLVHAIDFDVLENAFNDMIFFHHLLDTKGIFYLSFHGYDFCFASCQCLSVQFYDEENRRLAESFQKGIHSKQDQPILLYAGLGCDQFYEWTRLIPFLTESQALEVHFTFMHPAIARDKKELNDQFNPENIAYFIGLLLPGKTITVNLLPSLAAFNATLDSKKEYDFVTLIDYSPRNREEEESLRQSMHLLRSSRAWQFCKIGREEMVVQAVDSKMRGVTPLQEERLLHGLFREVTDSGAKASATEANVSSETLNNLEKKIAPTKK